VTGAAVIFPVGADTYAVAADTVREVVSGPRTTNVPTVAPELVGALNLRGEVVPVFDLAALLGIGTIVDAPFAVVVSTSAGPAGLLVSGLPSVVVLGDEIAAAELPGTLGAHRVDGGVAVLVDVEALLLPRSDADGPAADLTAR
jgi:purine-binding chemotaxis protein CheW